MPTGTTVTNVVDVNAQLETGKRLVEEYARQQGATEFSSWSKDFDTRDQTIEFSWESACCKIRVTNGVLTNLDGDSQKGAKLKALWDCKSKLDVE
jgi:hypothetical protein